MATRSTSTLTFCVALLGSACSWQAPSATPAPEAVPVTVPVVQARRDIPAAPEQAVAPRPSGAAAQLLEEAQRYRASGDQERAADRIERALRIDRASPWLYLELARVRAAQGQPQQASTLLAKAQAVAGGAPDVTAAVAVAARELQVTVPGH